ncbi:hypothetical protein F4861DRAFT_548947 [Xylaria intraflava]|nr:hypothetical protein F4861DRAFT_548947 [Xylaria intraflava]
MSNPQSSRPICQHFKRGNCKFGSRCRYSHDLTGHTPAGNRQTGLSTAARSQQRPGQGARDGDDIREWRQLINQGRHAPNRATCDRFFELALKLLDGDLGGLQEAVRLLANDNGLVYIRLLIERYIPDAHNEYAKQDIWSKQLRQLFTLITNQRVVDSAILEQPVATIYNFMQGIGSRRMKIMFDFVINLIRSAPMKGNQLTTTSSIAPKPVMVENCLAVLAKMIDCNTNNIVDETFKAVVQEIDSILQGINNTSEDYQMIQSKKWIGYINLRIEVGDGLQLPEARTAQNIDLRAQFTLPKNLPGILSSSGPRHDNDHADIADISILPTHDEIVSNRAEYLPTNDPFSFHRPGILGRLDREFRLLREDTIGQLRDVIRDLLEELQSGQQAQRREKKSLRAYTYNDAELIGATFEGNNGLDILVKFLQPVVKTTLQRRRDWWAQSKRLQPGALVCIINHDGSVLFCTVAENTTIVPDENISGSQHTQTENEASKQKKLSLAADEAYAYVHLNLADLRDDNLQQALEWYRNIGPNHRQCLVEFPGILLASFQHTLKALQKMSRSPQIPFMDLIAPEMQSEGTVEIPPPQYATNPEFYFDLSCLSKDHAELRYSPTEYLDPQVLTQQSTLDETQSSALLHSLSRSLALIQGPPGTGKSYTGEKIIKVLLANNDKVDLGPILCVCYTNHALDQLLEHLQDDGVDQIIRIGSRSKSERLEKVNLRSVARNADRTKPEKSALWNTKTSLHSQESTVFGYLRDLEGCLGRPALQTYLATYHSEHHKALFGTTSDQDGFQQVRRRRNQLFDQWLHSGRIPGPTSGSRQVEQLVTADLWTMNSEERYRLHDHWQRRIRDPIIRNLIDEHREYIQTRERRNGVIQEVDLRCLAAADVVGVTTTGLARNLDLLRRLGCRVLICEEAGEVLEAHNLTALLPSIQHCILIGDQLQLRPQIQNYDLNSTNPRGAKYSLDVSLFERLVSPSGHKEQKLPFDTLETQRRMHPSISDLIRRTLYPSLVDGSAVAGYPEVLGVRKRLFWLEHTMLEDRMQHQEAASTSHTNSFEVDMTVAFVQHLVRQGTYGPDDIAVITPYLGQLYRLRHVMQSIFQISVGERDLEELAEMEANTTKQEELLAGSVRLATVDNFQGEEAKVVVISLVRSNNERRCGFLSTPNRINVLLSRAKHGMYLIGNADTYGHVPMWAQVITMLRDGNNIGPAIQLQCPRHPNHPIEVSSPDHFLQFSPEGGCQRPCDDRLPCGHACVNRLKCPRAKKGCDHACRREKLENLNIVLPCGHKKGTALCWQAQNISSILCKEKTTKTVPGCNHTVTVPCHVDVTAADYKCTSVCGDPQPCGHSCRNECHRCKARRDGLVIGEKHEACQQLCNRGYTACRHTCQKPCHGQEKCPPCSKPCEVRCSHSKCSKKCHEPCAPCAEQKCSSACPHQKCTMPCAAPCNWVPCSRRCENILGCGHQCPSLCGEACPDEKYCQVCSINSIKTTVVDFIMGMQYHEIYLDEDPCIFPDCGHFLTKSNMDELMDLKSHYEMSAEESPNPIALSHSSKPFSVDEVKTCPSCRGSLRNIARYGRIIRRATLDEATKKFIAWSNSEFLKLADQLVDIQVALTDAEMPTAYEKTTKPPKLVISKGRLQQLHEVRDWVGGTRYRDALQLWAKISSFIGQVRKEEQPLQRVADFVRHASREQQITNEFAFAESVHQVKGVLQASALLLKCDLVIIGDFIAIRQLLLAHRPDMALDLTTHMRDCERLIDMAKSATYPREQIEGHIYYAQFSLFACVFSPESSEDLITLNTSNGSRLKLTDQARAHVAAARQLMEEYPSTRFLDTEIHAVEAMLGDGIFYSKVSASEIKLVYEAMSLEFSGTGHWYNCANGHPFTIGECGMPMENARCPECNAPVGGEDHHPAEGVRRADEIEDLGRDLIDLGI